jgi:hypothetical protein
VSDTQFDLHAITAANFNAILVNLLPTTGPAAHFVVGLQTPDVSGFAHLTDAVGVRKGVFTRASRFAVADPPPAELAVRDQGRHATDSPSPFGTRRLGDQMVMPGDLDDAFDDDMPWASMAGRHNSFGNPRPKRSE